MLIRIAFALLTAISLSSCANLNKEPDFLVTFHMEGNPIDGQTMVFPEHVGYPPKIHHFQITPEFSHLQIESFYPFESGDGKTHGLLVVLSGTGQRRLFSATSINQGKIMLVKLDGRTCDYLKIDGPIRDGIIKIGQGVTEEQLEFMREEWTELDDPPFAPSEREGQDALFDPMLR